MPLFDVFCKSQMTVALNSLVAQQLIRNERDGYNGLRGTYILEPAGLQAAGEALGLSNADLLLLQGLAPKKLNK